MKITFEGAAGGRVMLDLDDSAGLDGIEATDGEEGLLREYVEAEALQVSREDWRDL